MRYTLTFTKEAMRGFRAIPAHLVGYVGSAIDALADEPRPAGCQQSGEHQYRISEWGHLIEYEGKDQEVIVKIVFVQ